MSQAAIQLCEAVLALPRDERATIAAILADSLEEDDDPVEVAKAWDAEIKRRVEAADRGEVSFISHEELWQRLDAKYGKLED
jgi:putative addiction module component (TIGR02574 family)